MREKRKATCPPAQPRLRPCPPSPSHSPSVLLLWVYSCSLSFSLCFNVTREVTSYYPCPTFLAGMYKRHLYLVDVHSYMVVPIPLDIADQLLFFLSKNSILSAGYEKSTHIHTIDFFPIVITELPKQVDWDFPICFHLYNKYLYAFKLKYVNSEKYSSVTKHWEVIPHSNFLYQYPCFSLIWTHYCWFYMKVGEFIVFDFNMDSEMDRRLSCQLPQFNIVGTVIETEGEVVIICEYSEVYRFNVAANKLTSLGQPRYPWKRPKWQGYSLVLGEEIFWLDRETSELRVINTSKKGKRAIKLALP